MGIQGAKPLIQKNPRYEDGAPGSGRNFAKFPTSVSTSKSAAQFAVRKNPMKGRVLAARLNVKTSLKVFYEKCKPFFNINTIKNAFERKMSAG